MKHQLGMIFSSYCYKESKPNDDEDVIDLWLMGKMKFNGDTKLVKPVNQYMKPHASKFEVVSADDKYGCND